MYILYIYSCKRERERERGRDLQEMMKRRFQVKIVREVKLKTRKNICETVLCVKVLPTEL